MVALVDALPDQERRVINRHYFQNLEFTEIANIFGVTKGRISQIHKRALVLLREAHAIAGGIDLGTARRAWIRSAKNPVLDALRRQLAENIERLRRAGRLSAGTRSGPGGALARRGRNPGGGCRKLSSIDRRSPDGLSAATRSFVETVLVAEFGPGLLTDPGFGELAAELSESLRREPRCASRSSGCSPSSRRPRAATRCSRFDYRAQRESP